MNVEILRKKHQKYMRWGITISLILHLFIFHTSKRFPEPRPAKPLDHLGPEIINLASVTKQNHKPPPPKLVIPIAGEEESLPEMDPDLFFPLIDSEIKPPSPPEVHWSDKFEVVEKFPTPVGGYAAIIDHLVYPEIARKSETQGKVLIAVLIDKYGNVIDTKVEKSLPGGCDEAAIAAIKAVKWEPAMQRDEPVQVAVRIPIWFKLVN